MAMVFPCVLTNIVAALGFLLPPESGEKMSISITILLTLVVFMLVLTEHLPASVELPYLGTVQVIIGIDEASTGVVPYDVFIQVCPN